MNNQQIEKKELDKGYSMGRKGTNKRKPSQGKNKPFTGGAASNGVSSIVQAAESRPAKSLDIGKSSGKPSSDRKKTPNKS